MIMVVNVVCHSFLCGQSYVISIQAKINLSLQLVCNHGNYSTCFYSGLIIWQRLTVQAVLLSVVSCRVVHVENIWWLI